MPAKLVDYNFKSFFFFSYEMRLIALTALNVCCCLSPIFHAAIHITHAQKILMSKLMYHTKSNHTCNLTEVRGAVWGIRGLESACNPMLGLHG